MGTRPGVRMWKEYWRVLESQVGLGQSFTSVVVREAVITCSPEITDSSAKVYAKVYASTVLMEAQERGLLRRDKKHVFTRVGSLDSATESPQMPSEACSTPAAATATPRAKLGPKPVKRVLLPGRWRDQELHDEFRKGNCVQACLASILNRDINSVPHFVQIHESRWYPAFRAWLDDQGYEVLRLAENYSFSGYYLVIGNTERETSHMVVYQDGVLRHDPHPSRAGLTTIREILVLVPHDPSRMVRVSAPIPSEEI